MDKFAREFENIHRIPYVVDAVNGSHIPIVAPRLHAVDYYNHKGFHSILLRGVVSRKCMFWDFDIGWAGSMYDANLWRKTAVGQFYEAGKLAPYALVGDAAYPCRPWMLVPFRDYKDELCGSQPRSAQPRRNWRELPRNIGVHQTRSYKRISNFNDNRRQNCKRVVCKAKWDCQKFVDGKNKGVRGINVLHRRRLA
jgi:hypothetical protein